MDKLIVRNIQCECIIGIYPEERVNVQPIRVDLELRTDIRKPASTDQIDDAFDYMSLTKAVKEFIRASSFNLIETLTEKIAELILKQQAVKGVKVTLCKPHALPGDEFIYVEIERTQSE